MNKDKIMALIRKRSKESGVSINTLLLLYFFEHFLERIAASKYRTDLILKGGFLLSSVLGIQTRTTMDMDMSLRNHPLSESEIKKIFSELAASDSADGLRYILKSIDNIKIEDQYPGYKISMEGQIENIRQPFSIDVATGDPITPDAIEYPYCSVFEDEKTVKVMSYNLETIIAEKLETVVSRKTDNSRSKDFYDLYLLFNLKSDNLDKNKLRGAVNTTFAYRNTELDANSILSDLNDIQSNAGFRKRWELYCKRNAYVGELSFDQMIESLKGYISIYL